MTQVNPVKLENIPRNSYVVSKDEKRENFYKNESHIYKQGPFACVNAGVHKLYNNIVTYFPKGFKGSKNSDFYEFLSLGLFPYIVGSVTMCALYVLCNDKLRMKNQEGAMELAKRVAAGTVLYAVGKAAAPKISHTMIHATTGIPLDLKYINKVNELPEPGQEKGIVRKQFPGVYDSVQFYRCDLLAKDAELNHDSVYYHDDKIAKKAGFKDAHDASTNQIAGPKIRGVKARATALDNISKYFAAATGVALGFQEPFANIKLKEPTKWLKIFKDACVQLWKGNERNVLTKYGGKSLILLSAIGTTLAWLIPTIGFKKNPETMKSKVNTDKEYEVC